MVRSLSAEEKALAVGRVARIAILRQALYVQIPAQLATVTYMLASFLIFLTINVFYFDDVYTVKKDTCPGGPLGLRGSKNRGK